MTPLVTSRRLVAVAVAVLVGLAGCGDDDDGTPSSPAPTGANDAPEGNVDVTSSIAEPGVPASNIGALDSQAPYDP